MERAAAATPAKDEVPKTQNPDSPANIIPFPGEPRIIPVQFGSAKPSEPALSLSKEPALSLSKGPETEPQSPASDSSTENSAGSTPEVTGREPAAKKSPKPTKPNAEAHFRENTEAVPPDGPVHGTSTARSERNMDSRLASTPSDLAGDVAALSDVAEDMDLPAPGTHSSPDLTPGPTEWSSAPTSHWNAVNDVSPEIPANGWRDTAETVERINKLVGREVVLFRQHSSDSMAVVLRPDAHTELFLHLSRRDGQIEASVRCERGDFYQLNALWSQLQEALAHQKVRLNPLLESSGHPAFQHSDCSQSSGRDDESPRQSRPENDFMDEWPAPASPEQAPAQVRSRRESGHRLSTSRPGWETWA